jgi:hypothetical protein
MSLVTAFLGLWFRNSKSGIRNSGAILGAIAAKSPPISIVGDRSAKAKIRSAPQIPSSSRSQPPITIRGSVGRAAGRKCSKARRGEGAAAASLTRPADVAAGLPRHPLCRVDRDDGGVPIRSRQIPLRYDSARWRRLGKAEIRSAPQIPSSSRSQPPITIRGSVTRGTKRGRPAHRR